MSALSKYPARYKRGDKVVVTQGGFRGAVATVVAVENGWPYCNYVLDHDKEGALHVNEREIGLHRENPCAARATETTGTSDT